MYIVASNNKDSYEMLKKILNEFDCEYPIKLSDKIIFDEYAKKILDNGYLIYSITNEVVTGFVTFYANDYESYEGSFSLLGVKKEFRKNGIAAELFRHAFIIMINNGMKKAFSFTHKDNHSAIEFHEKMGFRIIDRITNQKYNVSLIKELNGGIL